MYKSSCDVIQKLNSYHLYQILTNVFLYFILKQFNFNLVKYFYDMCVYYEGMNNQCHQKAIHWHFRQYGLTRTEEGVWPIHKYCIQQVLLTCTLKISVAMSISHTTKMDATSCKWLCSTNEPRAWGQTLIDEISVIVLLFSCSLKASTNILWSVMSMIV